MQQQLAVFLVGHRRLPDGWKPVLDQQSQVPGVPLVGPLLARCRSMNRAGTSHQEFMTEFAHQFAEPTIVPRCFHSDAHRLVRQ